MHAADMGQPEQQRRDRGRDVQTLFGDHEDWVARLAVARRELLDAEIAHAVARTKFDALLEVAPREAILRVFPADGIGAGTHD